MTRPEVRRLFPSGAWEVSGEDPEGYYVTLAFYGYTKREAVALWRKQAPTYWRDLEAQEKRERQRT